MAVLINIKALLPDLPPGVTHVSTDWEAALDQNFTNIVYRKLGDTADLTVKNILVDGNGPFYTRSRVTLSVGQLDWSEPSVCGNLIKAPTVNVAGGPLTVAPAAVISTSAFDGPPGESHVATDYVIYDSANRVSWESRNNQTNLTSIQVPNGYLTPGEDYILSVRHIGVSDQSPFTTYAFKVSPVSAVTPDITIEGEPAHIPSGPKITTTPFSLSIGSDSHKDTEWEIYPLNNSGGPTNVPVYSKVTDSYSPDNQGDTLTELNVPDGTLNPGQTYVVRVTQNGYSVSAPTREEYFTVANVIIAPPDIAVESEPNSVPDGPVITLTPFTVLQGTDKYASTDYWIEDANGQNVWLSVGNNVDRESIKVPDGTLVRGTEYVVKARYNGFAGNSIIVSKTIYSNYPELLPLTISVEGAADGNVSVTPLITISNVAAADPNTPIQHTRTTWVIKGPVNSQPNTIRYSNTVNAPDNLTELLVPESARLVHGETYVVEVTVEIDAGNTESVNTVFTVSSIAIALPSITVAGAPNNVSLAPAIETTPFTVFPGTDIHVSSDWYIKEKATGARIWSSVADTSNLTSIDLANGDGNYEPGQNLQPDTEYVVTVRHNGELARSNYSSVTVKTAP